MRLRENDSHSHQIAQKKVIILTVVNLDVRTSLCLSAFAHKVKISFSRLAPHYFLMLTYRGICAESRPGAVWYR